MLFLTLIKYYHYIIYRRVKKFIFLIFNDVNNDENN
jgi:hypothetical protein